ncbi:hypothetical protein N658DRAFT_491843 [Parathielavia hyrcaniae]|uniref:Uncharacterized protein n=1 Tax=Parathielavia hyrcaniae TaxID=113614 RepID=A0AAN6Q833_9PEZI|nr:hypothetical protein N658DRAFT_491843 [Parathielavia hyrcaniae]
MNRHGLRAALGRGKPSTTARALQLPISTTTPTSFFSTATSRPADDDSHSNSNGSAGPRSQSAAAVARLSQLNTQRQNTTGPQDRRQDGSGFSRPAQFGGSRGGSRGGIDARSFRASPATTADAGSSPSAPKILNIRSLRGGLRSRTPFGRGGLTGGGLGGRDAGGEAGGFRPMFSSRGRRGGFRGGRSSSGSRMSGHRSHQIKTARDSNKGDKQSSAGKKLEWTREEQAVLDRLDKGEVVPFDPKMTADSLSGYGAAIATDAPIGPVETVMRNMRLMTGGMAFNAESGVTADLNEIMNRYRRKKPIFVHSKEEKAWIENSNPKLHLVGPDAGIKKAIVESAVLGKYEVGGFAELSDVKGTVTKYHTRTFTYKASDSQKFMDKVLSLLPAQGANKAAAQAKR